MANYTLRCETLVERSLPETFAIFSDPTNLSKITPSSVNFRVVTPGRIEMRRGAEIQYAIRWLGFSMPWRSVIRAYDPPNFFVDEQARGPYSFWRHTHTFGETSEGTLIGDRVDYALPFGPLGSLAHLLLVRWQLLSIFRYRQKTLPQLLNARTETVVAPFITRQISSPAFEPQWQRITVRV